jgi:AcrR family transcriptional regulator
VGELSDRRARKKLRTRTDIRTAAQRLFDERGFDAVTIADVAAEADVAVQTVFNHFATKEELFFDGRVPWVAGAAAAVRGRDAAEFPLAALRRYIVGTVVGLVRAYDTEAHRRFIAAIEASPALRAHELRLTYEAERLLAEALAEAWHVGATPGGSPVPGRPGIAAALIAATWLGAARAMVLDHRAQLADSGEALTPAEVEALAEQVLGRLEQAFGAEETRDCPTLTCRPGLRAG